MSSTAKRPRVAFVGNCQAQALESLSGHLGLPIEVVSLPAVFDMQAFSLPTTWERIRSCDFVFNQRVASDYPIEFARPAFLTESLGARSISWPNIYFDGYFPGIEYLYSHTGKIVGPAADYHFSFVRSAWAHGASVDDLTRSFISGPLANGFRHAADRSLNELRQREQGLSVRTSDWIAGRWRYEKLLYAMNHPNNATLFELLRRLLGAADIPVAMDQGLLSSYPYTLNEIDLPAFPSLHQAYGLGFTQNFRIRGKRLDFSRGRAVVQLVEQPYEWRELFETYYRLYDSIGRASADTAEILRNAVAWVG